MVLIKTQMGEVDDDINDKIDLKINQWEQNIELRFTQLSEIENRLVSLEQTWLEKIDLKTMETSENIKIWVSGQLENLGGSYIDEPQVMNIVAKYLKEQLDILVKK